MPDTDQVPTVFCFSDNCGQLTYITSFLLCQEGSYSRVEAKKVLGKSILGTEIGRKWLCCRKTCRKSELLRPHELMWFLVFSVCLDVSVFNMADTELYSSHSESPAETGQHAHSLTKNSLRLQWCAAPFLYSCFPCSEERLLVGWCVFFCISVHHGGGCSYMGVYTTNCNTISKVGI